MGLGYGVSFLSQEATWLCMWGLEVCLVMANLVMMGHNLEIS